jgi:arylsulfatase A-like enzyme
VPFVIAAPDAIDCSTHSRSVVSLVDTAPTVLDLLGLPIPSAYEGRSMLDGRPRAALFFTDYSLPLAGLRDGPRKVIHELRSGRTRWFDVDADPEEHVDLSSRYPEETRRYAETLRGWTAAQRHALSRSSATAARD